MTILNRSFPIIGLGLILGIQLYFLINLRFTAWPEMFSYAYLRNNSFLLYKDMIHPYPPLLTMGLSLVYKAFGYNLEVLKAIVWSAILLSTSLTFYVINYVTGRRVLSLIVVGIYVFLQPFLEGNMLWFDLAIVPPVLLGMIFLLKHLEKEEGKWIILAGFSLAIAALTKQTAAIFLVFAIVFLFVRHRSFKEVGLLGVGSVVLSVPLLTRLVQEGALLDFVRWTLLYPIGQWSYYPAYVQMYLNTREWLLMAIFFLPLILLIIVRRRIWIEPRFRLLLLFLAGALLAVYPRFSFFHFQLALALLVITLAFFLREVRTKNVLLAESLFLLILFPIVHVPRLSLDWQRETRFYEKMDTDLADKIADITDSNDLVFLLGVHSGIYVMADRLPPKRWTDNFGWYLETPGVQEEILQRWKDNAPKYIVWRIPGQGNWFDLGVYQPQKIVDFIKSDYTFKGELVEGIEIWQRKDL